MRISENTARFVTDLLGLSKNIYFNLSYSRGVWTAVFFNETGRVVFGRGSSPIVDRAIIDAFYKSKDKALAHYKK